MSGLLISASHCRVTNEKMNTFVFVCGVLPDRMGFCQIFCLQNGHLKELFRCQASRGV